MNRNELVVMKSYFGYKSNPFEFRIKKLTRMGKGIYFLDPDTDFCETVSDDKTVFVSTTSFLKWAKGFVPEIGDEFRIRDIDMRMIGHLSDKFIVQDLTTNQISQLPIEVYFTSKT